MGKTALWQLRYAQVLFELQEYDTALINFKKADESNQISDKGLKKQLKVWIHKSMLELGNPNVGNINEAVYLDKKEPEVVAQPKVVETTKPTETIIEHTGEFDEIKELAHDWYQNSDFVFLTVLKKKLKGNCQIVFSQDHTDIHFEAGKNFRIHLAHSIKSEESSYTQTDKKVEIKLRKQEQGIVWDILK